MTKSSRSSREQASQSEGESLNPDNSYPSDLDRTRKIEALRVAIVRGEYRIPTGKVAQKIIDFLKH